MEINCIADARLSQQIPLDDSVEVFTIVYRLRAVPDSHSSPLCVTGNLNTDILVKKPAKNRG